MCQNDDYNAYEISPDYAKKMFAKSLKEIMKENKITQTKLAEDTPIAPASISAYEREKKEPRLTALLMLALYFNCSLDELCGFSPENYKKDDLSKSLLSIIDKLKASIHVDEENKNIIFSLSSENDCETYSALEILNFFKNYEIIQNFALANPPRSMITILEKNLIKDYRNLPELPDYEDFKKRTTAET